MVAKFNNFLKIVAPLLLLGDTKQDITFSAEQIIPMPFYYVQDVYHKNQLGTLDKRQK